MVDISGVVVPFSGADPKASSDCASSQSCMPPKAACPCLHGRLLVRMTRVCETGQLPSRLAYGSRMGFLVVHAGWLEHVAEAVRLSGRSLTGNACGCARAEAAYQAGVAGGAHGRGGDQAGQAHPAGGVWEAAGEGLGRAACSRTPSTACATPCSRPPTASSPLPSKRAPPHAPPSKPSTERPAGAAAVQPGWQDGLRGNGGGLAFRAGTGRCGERCSGDGTCRCTQAWRPRTTACRWPTPPLTPSATALLPSRS